MQVMQEIRPIEFMEDELLVKTLTDEDELKASFHLRHQVFAERLKWVGCNQDRLEIDTYDSFATSVGLFDGAQLRGVFRMVAPPYPFMLESEFRSCLAPGSEIRRERDTVEITRLAIDPTLSDRGLSIRFMQVLFKGVYQWSIQNDVRFLYMVVEKRFLRVLRGMGFSCEAISQAVCIPPAEALSIAAVLDWQRFREVCPVENPAFYNWIDIVDGSTVFEKSGFVAKDARDNYTETRMPRSRWARVKGRLETEKGLAVA
ncbi:protein of unknown function, putative N-acyl-L-homoserine lactone synthetase [Nitrospira sp. KM1]|uniref:acyl-homoserine-lactone synthase n=1 Tax=Nitrospira sp. KM1 TaxID=1936990 RepID=UPI0013A752FB|nr:acyl-homoserine-lactone synthase [Nitrospira sp. KM1]BCA55733.1 protein of unknown function, putative N-acyl-L-homoserine lactone synthetase [Nitrospira sp. KM1]